MTGNLRNIDHEEISTPVMKYMLKELDDKVVANHSEILTKFGILEGKIDSLAKTINTVNIENAEMRKDIEHNKESISAIWKGLYAVGVIVFGGLVNFCLGFLRR